MVFISEEEDSFSVRQDRIETHTVKWIDDLNDYLCQCVTRGIKNDSSAQPPNGFYFSG